MSTKYFQKSMKQLAFAYTSALEIYLTESGEDALRQAYELGREAVRSNLGILDMAGLYAGALSVHVKPVDVQDFLCQVFERLEPEVQLQGMKLDLHVAKSLPEVKFDPERVEQVITNLVQNAVKYAAEAVKLNSKH